VRRLERGQRSELAVLATDNLLLRPFRMDDLGDLTEYHTNRQVQQGYDINGEPWSDEQISDRLKSYIAAIEEFGFSRWKVTLKDGGFAGRASLCWYDDESVEIGYGLMPEFWGKGFAQEVATTLVRWGFENLSISRIVAFTFVGNQRSQRLLKTLGLEYVEDKVRNESDGLCSFFELPRSRFDAGNTDIVSSEVRPATP
jgi:[ribosomal protein S5]-alanine N-acetyltransferase